MSHPDPKVLIIAPCYAPDHKNGSTTLLTNLIQHFDKTRYVFMRGPFAPGAPTELPPELQHKRYVLKFPPLSWRGQKQLRPLAAVLTILQGLMVVARERPTKIWLNFPYDYTLIAGYYVARLTRRPLHVFMHDLWEENTSGRDRKISHFFEGRILRSAERVYAITEQARDFYIKKYQLRDVKVLLHSTNLELRDHCGEPVTDPVMKEAFADGKPTIVFTGSIYRMNRDAIANLVNALKNFGQGQVRLIFCTGHSRQWLENEGLWFEDTALSSVSQAELMRIYSQANVLFLPLTFKDAISRQEIETVFPTKCLEYFMAGRPILSNAPAYSYVAHEIKEKQWGHIVTEADPEALWKGLKTLLDDPEYAARLGKNAGQSAEERDSKRISAQLWQWLTEK